MALAASGQAHFRSLLFPVNTTHHGTRVIPVAKKLYKIRDDPCDKKKDRQRVTVDLAGNSERIQQKLAMKSHSIMERSCNSLSNQ